MIGSSGESISGGGVGGASIGRVVNLEHRTIRSLSSGILILRLGSHSKIRRKIPSSSGDNGKMELKNLGFLR